MYVYCGNPIDFWTGWMTEAEYLATLETVDFDGNPTNEGLAAYYTRLGAAQVLAKRVGWEGDMRQGPFVSGLPTPDSPNSEFLIGWKQDNNGTTFVASPYELPWLSKDWACVKE